MLPNIADMVVTIHFHGRDDLAATVWARPPGNRPGKDAPVLSITPERSDIAAIPEIIADALGRGIHVAVRLADPRAALAVVADYVERRLTAESVA